MLYQAEDAPQVIVTVDDMPAVCAGVACGYTYEDPTSLVTGFTVSGQNVVIDGTALPTSYLSVTLSNVECVPNTDVSETQIDCDLQTDWVAGDWTPVLMTSDGVIPVDGSVTPHSVPLTVDSVTPETLNPAGGELVTVVGSGFPA